MVVSKIKVDLIMPKGKRLDYGLYSKTATKSVLFAAVSILLNI